MAEPLTRVPLALVQGTTVAWRFESADYLPADGWSLLYAFEGPSTLNVAAGADGAGFLTSLTGAQTAALLPGVYVWQGFASRSTPTVERVAVCAGSLEVVLDLQASPATGQQKTHARRMVELLEAVLEGRATDGQLRMSINGRSIDRIPPLELLAMRDRYRSEVRAEEAAAAQGVRPGRRRPIKARF